MVSLGLLRRGGSSGHGSSSRWSSALPGSFGFVGFTLALSLVGLDLGLDSFLCFNIVELLLTLASSLLDLLLAREFLFGLLTLFCGLLSDLLIAFCLFLVLVSAGSLLCLDLCSQLLQALLLLVLSQRGNFLGGLGEVGVLTVKSAYVPELQKKVLASWRRGIQQPSYS